MVLNNLEHLKAMKKRDQKWLKDHNLNPENDFLNVTLNEWRKIRAQEIIAETLIKIYNELLLLKGRQYK